MTKIILLLMVLFASPSYAPITLGQTKTIQVRCYNMQKILSKMIRLAGQTGESILGGNSFTLDFSTKTYSLTAAQEQDIVNYYNNLKNQLEVEFNALP